MEEDKELLAMAAVVKSLEELDDLSKQRVIDYVISRFALNPSVLKSKVGQVTEQLVEDVTSAKEEYENIADFFDSTNPKSSTEKVLVVSYYLQKFNGLEDLDSQSVNTELKNLGHGVSNITDAFTRMMLRKPRWAIQTRKSGSSRQARKKYRITNEGAKKVELMMKNTYDDA